MATILLILRFLFYIRVLAGESGASLYNSGLSFEGLCEFVVVLSGLSPLGLGSLVQGLDSWELGPRLRLRQSATSCSLAHTCSRTSPREPIGPPRICAPRSPVEGFCFWPRQTNCRPFASVT